MPRRSSGVLVPAFSRPSRRHVLAGGLLAGVALAAPARVGAQTVKPIRIGLTCDQSGQFALSGRDELRGIRLAIEEQNRKGGVLGRPVAFVTDDTRTSPDAGEAVAERFVMKEDCAFLIGAVHSGVAEAITRVAARAGTIYFNTNSSATTQAGADCARVKFVWDGNGANFARAMVANAIRAAGRNWVLVVNDYVWGHNTAAATTRLVERYGGRVVEKIVVAPNTTDFGSIVSTIRQLRPDVVATAIGGEDSRLLRAEVVAQRLEGRPAWVGSQLDWPDVWQKPETLFGVFGTTWYHGLELPGVADFVARWRAAYGASRPPELSPMPGNVSYNGYMATRELFRAIERTGTTNNIAIIRALEGLRVPAADRMQHFDAYMDERTHQLQQTIYLARRNPNPRDSDDLFELLAWAPPADVADEEAPGACRLTPHERVPVVDA